MIGLLFQLATLGVAALAVLALIVTLARRPIVIVYAILGAHGWDVLAGGMPSLSVMGVAVGPSELVHMIAFGAGLLRARRGPNRWQLALLGALALVFVGALRGYVMLGDAAMLGFRAELYYLVPAFFVSTLPASAITSIVAAIVRFGVAMAVVALSRWVALALGVPWVAAFANTGYAIERVINSGAALAVAFALVAVVQRAVGSGAIQRFRLRSVAAAAVLIGVVVMAQHRSVWVATLTMLGLLFVRLPRRLHLKIAVMAAVVAAVAAIELSGFGDTGAVAESLTQAATNAGTWEWRLERWDAVWATHTARGWEAILFGSGYGYSWVSGEVGVWEASPHNGFLQVAVRLGLVGAVLVFGVYGYVLRVVAARAQGSGAVAWLWIVGTLVYFLPYSGSPMTGVVLGAALLQAADPSSTV